MTRPARILAALYTAVTLWLTYCTAQTWGTVPLWISITMAAAALVPIVAGRREAEHADDMRALRVQLERAARPSGPGYETWQHPDTRTILSTGEKAAWSEITAAFNDKDQAA